jgi:hypothetical protein
MPARDERQTHRNSEACEGFDGEADQDLEHEKAVQDGGDTAMLLGRAN